MFVLRALASAPEVSDVVETWAWNAAFWFESSWRVGVLALCAAAGPSFGGLIAVGLIVGGFVLEIFCMPAPVGSA
jgi:hypothetical protein